MALRGKDLRELETEELERRASELRRSIFNLRVRMGTKELEDTSKIGHEKRDLARLLTVLGERGRNGAVSVTPKTAPSKKTAAKAAKEKPAKRATKKPAKRSEKS
jgi:large subunit ribosomal protein L29